MLTSTPEQLPYKTGTRRKVEKHEISREAFFLTTWKRSGACMTWLSSRRILPRLFAFSGNELECSYQLMGLI